MALSLYSFNYMSGCLGMFSVIVALSLYNSNYMSGCFWIFGMFRDGSGCFCVIMPLSLYSFNYMSGCFGMFRDVSGCRTFWENVVTFE